METLRSENSARHKRTVSVGFHSCGSVTRRGQFVRDSEDGGGSQGDRGLGSGLVGMGLIKHRSSFQLGKMGKRSGDRSWSRLHNSVKYLTLVTYTHFAVAALH